MILWCWITPPTCVMSPNPQTCEVYHTVLWGIHQACREGEVYCGALWQLPAITKYEIHAGYGTPIEVMVRVRTTGHPLMF